jgi:hypothetical protein
LDRIFEQAPTKLEAHRRSEPLLRELVGHPRFLEATLAHHLEDPAALNTLNFPSIGINLSLTVHYTLVVNVFLPWPTGETDITLNAIHHHGQLMLTTVTAYGTGYEHWLFATPKPLHPAQHLFSLTLIERGLHPPQHLAFVDAYHPHAVMAPKSLTITLALWSSCRPTTWQDRAKRLAVFRGREKTLARVVRAMGLTRRLAVNDVNLLDYYPTTEGFKGMPEREQFERGPNEDYLYTLFHILQRTTDDRLASSIEQRLRGPKPPGNAALVTRLLADLRAGNLIEPRRTAALHQLPHMNFRAADITQTLEALRARSVEHSPPSGPLH